MKILIIIPSYKPADYYGGPIRSVATLCEELVNIGQDVTVYTTNANGPNNLNVVVGINNQINGVTIIYHTRLTKDHTNFSFGLLKRFYTTINQFDIVHIHSWWNLVCIPVAFICYIRRKKFIISPRGSLSEFTFKHKHNVAKIIIHKLIGYKLLNNAIIHTTSIKEKNEILLELNKEAVLIPNIIELNDLVERDIETNRVFKLIFIGRVEPVKNIELLLDVLSDDFTIPYEFNIIGNGNVKYVNKLKQKVAGNDKIKWLGSIAGFEKWKKLRHADLLVLPSHTENYGNVVLEALSQGTAVLISDQVGIKDFVVDNGLGWCIKNDPKEWYENLQIIWSDSLTRNAIRQKAPGIIKSLLNKERIVSEYIKLYEETMSS